MDGLGVISVLSNIAPKKTHQIAENFLNGNIKQAINMQLKAIPLIQSLFCEVNPIPVKMALNIIGYNFGSPRLPLIDLNDEHTLKLKTELEKYNIL